MEWNKISKQLSKVLFLGLDNGGKTSILLLLAGKFSLLTSIKPTLKAKITSQALSTFLGMDVASWDLGGQKKYREMYLQNKEKYFTDIQTIFFVIDVQEPERFDEAYDYLKEVVDIVVGLNPEHTNFFILLHKFDPDIKKNKEVISSVILLKDRIKAINTNYKFFFYETSIHDEVSLVKPFSDGVISVSHKALMIQSLLKEYTKKSFNSAAVLLDSHCFIIASRATKEDYEIICQEIAPRMTQSIERLEDLGVCKTNDIETNIMFPAPETGIDREGIIFLRKLDLNKERMYLIALCLNKKIKIKAVEYLPLLAENLKNLLETFE